MAVNKQQKGQAHKIRLDLYKICDYMYKKLDEMEEYGDDYGDILASLQYSTSAIVNKLISISDSHEFMLYLFCDNIMDINKSNADFTADIGLFSKNMIDYKTFIVNANNHIMNIKAQTTNMRP